MKAHERSLYVRARRLLRPWLHAEDYQAALVAAGVELTPNNTKPVLEAAAGAIDMALRVLVLPGSTSLRSVAQDLKAIGKCGAVALKRFLPELPGILAGPVPRTALTDLLARSELTVIIALLDAASAESGAENAAAMVADAIITGGSLRPWAEAARDQYLAGSIREERSEVRLHEHLPGDRDLARTLGMALIETYVALTGRSPGISRIPPGVDDAGRPSGPMIRYLLALYGCLRARLEAIPATHDLARDKTWSPSPETLASWSVAYRRKQDQPAS